MLKEISLYKGVVKLSVDIDEEKHECFDCKGKKIEDSVTGATGIIDKSGALMGWVAKMMGLYLLAEKDKGNFQITEEMIDRAKREYRRLKTEAADLGTEIHKWTSDWIKGKNPAMPTDERVVNGITAFLKFQKEHKVKWLESERIIYSKKHNYWGVLDAIGKIGKDLVLIDFKSSSGIYPEMFIQTAGYQLAYEEETGKKITKRMIVKFGKEDGKFEVRELDNGKEDQTAFVAALTLKRRISEIK